MWKPERGEGGAQDERKTMKDCQVQRDGEWEECRSLIDDSDSVSWQMPLDRIDIMRVGSIWLFTHRKETKRRSLGGRLRTNEHRETEQAVWKHVGWCRRGRATCRSHFVVRAKKISHIMRILCCNVLLTSHLAKFLFLKCIISSSPKPNLSSNQEHIILFILWSNYEVQINFL